MRVAAGKVLISIPSTTVFGYACSAADIVIGMASSEKRRAGASRQGCFTPSTSYHAPTFPDGQGGADSAGKTGAAAFSLGAVIPMTTLARVNGSAFPISCLLV